MGFLDNARKGTIEEGLANNVHRGIEETGSNDLVEVTVRVKRMSLVKYTEAPFVIPRHCLPSVYDLAASYRRNLDVIAVEHAPGNDTYSVQAFVKMDETVVIEVVTRSVEPESDDEQRRRAFRSVI